MPIKARKYRLAPGASLTPSADGHSAPHAASPAAPHIAPNTASPSGATLSAQQIRQARKNAQKHNIAATDDLDAIQKLQAIGVDPFAPSDLLEGPVRTPTAAPPAAPRPSAIGQLQRAAPPAAAAAPGPAAANAAPFEDARLRAQAARDAELNAMRRGIAKRRRRNMALLVLRLVIFVGLPTLCAAWYFFFAATRMYATETEFLIEQPSANFGAMGGAAALTGAVGGMQDAVTVQAWLSSREAMLRLDAEEKYRAHFNQPWIDPLQRLPDLASNEDLFELYKKHVKVAFDPMDGIVRMEVIAADPESSQRFATALLGYAEGQIAQLSSRLRSDQVKGAEQNYKDAEERRSKALDALLKIQVEAEQLDPAGEVAARTQQLSALESERQRLELDLRARSAVARPNEAQLNDLRQRIANLDTMMTELRSAMTQSGSDGRASLAIKNTELRIAEENYTFQSTLVQQALIQMETARIEADRQARYVNIGVAPVAPDSPTYPRAFENTVLAFMIFAGLYLMLSITASILREQLSS